MHEMNWVKLNEEKIAPSTHPKDAAWTLESPSIYDIPSHVRSEYCPTTGFLKIEFRYLEQEKIETITLSNYLRAEVGKKSKRIIAIEFDIHSYNKDKNKIAKVAEESIGMINTAKLISREITSRVIHLNMNSLFNTKALSVGFSQAG